MTIASVSATEEFSIRLVMCAYLCKDLVPQIAIRADLSKAKEILTRINAMILE